MITFNFHLTAVTGRLFALVAAIAVLLPMGEAQGQERFAVSMGALLPFEVGDVQLETDYRLLSLGLRVDPGQDKRFGPTASAYLAPYALSQGALLLFGEVGVAGRLQGDQMALIPRVALSPIVLSGSGGGAADLDGSIGFGVEFRGRGSDMGLLVDWSYRGLLSPGGVMSLGVGLIL